jgi:hypothetical protein
MPAVGPTAPCRSGKEDMKLRLLVVIVTVMLATFRLRDRVPR